ncbi:MAG TPA: hypothetical protein VJJ52_05515 [Candidatus Nanoarchaeia archaeon]|nr:hypothetical protein [Candidatus Nanoarchaeia archaeon]
MSFNKRASLEISIQAIVIVVLAMTILGLGLGFVRGLFKNITSTTEDVTEQVRQKILDDLITGDKKIAFPKTEVLVDRGGSTILSVGIRNKNNNDLDYKLKFCAVSAPDTTGVIIPTNDCDKFASWFQFDTTKVYKLSPSDSTIRNIKITLPSVATSGSYFFTFEVSDDVLGAPYDQKDFFIVVRG